MKDYVHGNQKETLEPTGFSAQKGHFQVFIFYITPRLSPLLRIVGSLLILKSRIMFCTAALQVIKNLARTLVSHLPCSSLPKQFLKLQIAQIVAWQWLCKATSLKILEEFTEQKKKKKNLKLISSFAESAVLHSLSQALLT